MPGSDPAGDLALLTEAARAAGRVALKYTGRTARKWEKSGGLGPVTEADLAVDDLLRTSLTAARPDYGWLSEESEDTQERHERERVFIVDPIDGTRSFIEGNDTWAHSLAIAEGGTVIAAAVYLPLKGRLYSAAQGRGAFLNDRPIRVSARSGLPGARVLAAKPNYDSRHWPGGVPEVARHYRPSLAYRLSLVAEGRFDAMLTLRASWEWDIAAGELILREAGAVTTDRRGGRLRFNNPHPQVDGVVAAGPGLHAEILTALGVAGVGP
ncbi:inositol monophosphatase family protein [Pseudooceanicola batsensis HTCC2597]|uniref:Inositol monophosphatase family protein n=1 Tax=Pseudooceanicola batsensis (strain ATCC BAA-863 / DSM 15984 / KCTC 12145 / HTCC2597) TaxID=252305 RepID=A3TW87_PSEBH|nr:3'(2'),5'-bisphosphate nucleotidase CysQ [Pseudooceanicola batsensis]EAQ03883.1 inositol monophosphatase family protein [Pseudooceanicola batsensis HTCC2597]